MKITAFMVVRDEENILPTSIGYLLNVLAVDQLIIADNGSTDGTRAIVQRASKLDRRVEWLEVPGPYRQSEIVTGIAREAHLKGSDWILANDADEFYWFGQHKIRDLCASKSVGAYTFNVCNFVQWRWVLADHPCSTETMIFSARPIGKRENARHLVETRRIAFVQMRYPMKLFLRATPSLTIHMGNHQADGIDGESIEVSWGDVLHAPMRSHQSLISRSEQGRRIAALEFDDNIAWHVRRLVHFQKDELEEEWRMNSTCCGLIGPKSRKKPLRFDLRLRRISRSQNSFAAALRSE